MYTKPQCDSAWKEVSNEILTPRETEEARKAWDEYHHPDFLFPTGEFLLAWKIQQEKIRDLQEGIQEAVRLMGKEQKRAQRAENSAKTFDSLHRQACLKLAEYENNLLPRQPRKEQP